MRFHPNPVAGLAMAAAAEGAWQHGASLRPPPYSPEPPPVGGWISYCRLVAASCKDVPVIPHQPEWKSNHASAS